jgi:hypothetical protein
MNGPQEGCEKSRTRGFEYLHDKSLVKQDRVFIFNHPAGIIIHTLLKYNGANKPETLTTW